MTKLKMVDIARSVGISVLYEYRFTPERIIITKIKDKYFGTSSKDQHVAALYLEQLLEEKLNGK